MKTGKAQVLEGIFDLKTEALDDHKLYEAEKLDSELETAFKNEDVIVVKG